MATSEPDPSYVRWQDHTSQSLSVAVDEIVRSVACICFYASLHPQSAVWVEHRRVRNERAVLESVDGELSDCRLLFGRTSCEVENRPACQP